MILVRTGILLLAFTSPLLQAQTLPASPDIVEGTWTYRTDAESVEQLGDSICFVPVPGSKVKYARPPADPKMTWFCFANDDDAKRMLRIPAPLPAKGCGVQGQATIEIGEGRPAKPDTDDVDAVRLIAVRKAGDVREIPCAR